MNSRNSILFAYAALFFAPGFFTTNILFGKLLVTVEPFTLAFLRWGFATIILLALCKKDWPEMIRVYRANKTLTFFAGFLAFWVCGGIVYLALHDTTATNGTLIYTTPPILIILIEAFWRGRPISWREMLGIIVAVAGACWIVLNGRISNLTTLDFNPGDLLFVVAAISWAIYSVLLKSEKFSTLSTLPLLALFSAAGTITLAPFTVYELATTGNIPNTQYEWIIIACIVFLSSIFSFLMFQHGLSVLGASIAGIFMYLLAPWGIFYAWVFLGERLEDYHATGIILILGGVIIATAPLAMLRKKRSA